VVYPLTLSNAVGLVLLATGGDWEGSVRVDAWRAGLRGVLPWCGVGYAWTLGLVLRPVTLSGSNNGNPLKTDAGAVSYDEKAPSANWAMPWLVVKECLYSRNKITYMDRTGPFVLDRG